MEEASGRVLQDGVAGSRGSDLRLLDNVRVEAIDAAAGLTANVAAAVVVARCVDLLITQIRQIRRWCRLCSTISVTVEDVCPDHLFGLSEGSRGQRGEERQSRVMHGGTRNVSDLGGAGHGQFVIHLDAMCDADRASVANSLPLYLCASI